MVSLRAAGPGDAADGSMTERLSGGVASGHAQMTPLTERILSRLPGPRFAWIAAWALVPWLNLSVVEAVAAVDQGAPRSTLREVLNRAAVTVAIVLALSGGIRIIADLRRLSPALATVVEQDEPEVAALFRRIDSTLVPLLLTAASMVVLPIDEALAGDVVAALIQALTWLIIGIPLWTAIWIYLTVQVGLGRLGRGQLTLQAYQGDRSLGLLPVGRLAFTAFWMLLGVVGPLVLTNASDIPGAVVGIVVLLAGLGLFFWSLRRLHRQMVAVRERELEMARGLYMQTYKQVRDQPTLEELGRQAGLLKAAEELERRAERILVWPFDEVTFARVVAIASSVTAGIIARLLLEPVGL
jgi:hypothetical protein